MNPADLRRALNGAHLRGPTHAGRLPPDGQRVALDTLREGAVPPLSESGPTAGRVVHHE